MPTFDDTLKTYQDKRTELRGLQGEIQTATNEYTQKGKAIGALKRRYNSVRKQLQTSQDALIPELKKEVAAHPVMDPHAEPDELPTTDAERVEIDTGSPEKIELEATVGKAPVVEKDKPEEKAVEGPTDVHLGNHTAQE